MKPVDAMDFVISEPGALFASDDDLGSWDEDGLGMLEAAVNLLVHRGYLICRGTVLSRTPKGADLNALPARSRRRQLSDLLTIDDGSARDVWKVDRVAWRVASQAHQRMVVQGRIEILDGIAKGIDNLSRVNQLVWSAADRSEAVAALMGSELGLTELQAQHVLDLPVSSQTELGRQELAAELAKLQRLFDELSDE